MLYDKQEKVQDPNNGSESSTSSHKTAPSETNLTQQPAWTKALGDQPPVRLQAKLTVDQPGDVYEQEADQVADRVMRMPTSETAATQEDVSLMRKESGSTGTAQAAPPIVNSLLSSGEGRPIDTTTRAAMEPRFGQDFSQVRVHTDEQAAASAQAINARAYTVGKDVVFGAGQYELETSEGQRLLAHELTHVVQQEGTGRKQISPIVLQKAPRTIQGSFFGDLWEGIKSVGRAIGGAATAVGRGIGTAASAVGHAIGVGAQWVGERIRDIGDWALSLVRDLPMHLVRFGQAIVQGLVGIATFIPDAIGALRSGGIRGFANWLWERAKSGGVWVLTLLDRIFDLVGGPELTEFLLHLMEHTSPLTAQQRAAAQLVLGRDAIRWNQVRVAEGGVLSIIFHFNEARAFTTFHTINLPPGTHLATVVHELTHVYQYERVGSIYIGGAIHAQATLGARAYDYGDLNAARLAGKHYRDFNREQQAQIAENYYIRMTTTTLPTTEFDPFIAELRAGDL